MEDSCHECTSQNLFVYTTVKGHSPKLSLVSINPRYCFRTFLTTSLPTSVHCHFVLDIGHPFYSAHWNLQYKHNDMTKECLSWPFMSYKGNAHVLVPTHSCMSDAIGMKALFAYAITKQPLVLEFKLVSCDRLMLQECISQKNNNIHIQTLIGSRLVKLNFLEVSIVLMWNFAFVCHWCTDHPFVISPK